MPACVSRMALYFTRCSSQVGMPADWTTEALDQEKLVLLFISYMFFSIIVMTFIIFLVCITQISSVAMDIHIIMTLLAVSFIVVNIVVADFLVHAMNLNRDIRILFSKT